MNSVMLNLGFGEGGGARLFEPEGGIKEKGLSSGSIDCLEGSFCTASIF
jgi:hypothetical protein